MSIILSSSLAFIKSPDKIMIRKKLSQSNTIRMLKEKFNELQDKLLEETKSFYGNRLVSFVVFGSHVHFFSF